MFQKFEVSWVWLVITGDLWNIFSLIAAPLTWLTRKGVKYEWDEKCEQSFQELKNHLITAPVLVLPTVGVGYLVFSDASKQELGCVLMQNDRIIAYAFR